MLAGLTMFAARFGSFYPANHSPRKIETKKNKENLQAPAVVLFMMGKLSLLTLPRPSAMHLSRAHHPLEW